MERKNIFQLINENYNINNEIRKIDNLFKNQNFFYKFYDYYGELRVSENFTLSQMLEQYLFAQWKHRGTCISIVELFKRANAELHFHDQVIDENIITNYIEVMLNLIKLSKDNISFLRNKFIASYSNFNDVFCNLVDTLRQHFGLAAKTIDGAVVLFPENAALEQVLKLAPDESAQWELIRYTREKMSLDEKRKSLAYFATRFYIEQDDKEKDSYIKPIMKETTNILNSINIRHNNETGKWEKSYIKEISEKDMCQLCDMAFNNILAIILLREQEKYKDVYKKFKDKQKQENN